MHPLGPIPSAAHGASLALRPRKGLGLRERRARSRSKRQVVSPG